MVIGWIPPEEYINPPETAEWRKVEADWLLKNPRPQPPPGVTGKDFTSYPEFRKWVRKHKQLQKWAHNKGIRTRPYARARPKVYRPKQTIPVVSLKQSVVKNKYLRPSPRKTLSKMPPTKKIGGETFRHLSDHKTKAIVLEKAKIMRNKGKKIRVLDNTSKSSYKYSLYGKRR